MDTPATAPVSTATTSSAVAPDEAAVMSAAIAADNGTGTTPSAETTPPAQGKDGKPAEQGKDSAKPEEKPAGDKPAATDKPATDKSDSAFSKAKKDSERRDNSWKALDAEKNAFREEKTKIEAEVQTLRRENEQLRKQPPAPAAPVKDEHGFDAATYEALAKRYDAEGKDDMATLAREKVAALQKLQATTQPDAPAVTAGEAWKTPEFQKTWDAGVAQLVATMPELKDPNHPLVKATNAYVNDPKWGRFFRSHPDGIHAAVEVAKMQQEAARVGEVTKQLATATAEIERLNKLVQPAGSHAGGPVPEAKKFTDMSAAEAENAVLAAAAAADRGSPR